MSETQTPCMNQAPANLVGDFLISSKRESEPALWTRWKRKLLGGGFGEKGQLCSPQSAASAAAAVPNRDITGRSARENCTIDSPSQATSPKDTESAHNELPRVKAEQSRQLLPRHQRAPIQREEGAGDEGEGSGEVVELPSKRKGGRRLVIAAGMAELDSPSLSVGELLQLHTLLGCSQAGRGHGDGQLELKSAGQARCRALTCRKQLRWYRAAK